MHEQRKTILLVEDEGLIALAEREMLKRHGFCAIIAHSGETAIEELRTNPGIDLVLMDINLGKGRMDGAEAAEIILQDHDIPVLFLSSYSPGDTVEKTGKLPYCGYVEKDAGDDVLLASIERAFKLDREKTGGSHGQSPCP